jgi:hypothetical protein
VAIVCIFDGLNWDFLGIDNDAMTRIVCGEREGPQTK